MPLTRGVAQRGTDFEKLKGRRDRGREERVTLGRTAKIDAELGGSRVGFEVRHSLEFFQMVYIKKAFCVQLLSGRRASLPT